VALDPLPAHLTSKFGCDRDSKLSSTENLRELMEAVPTLVAARVKNPSCRSLLLVADMDPVSGSKRLLETDQVKESV